MNLLNSLMTRLTRPSAPARNARPPQSSLPVTHIATEADSRSQMHSRRELMRIALRDVKATVGIPAPWLQMNALSGTSPRRGPGLYASLVVKHANPMLMQHAFAIERLLVQRIMMIDPLALDWLIGVSWKFELDEEVEPDALPSRSAWLEPAQPGPALHEMGFINRSVLIPGQVPSAMERLNAEMAEGDTQRRYTTGMEPTEPAGLS
ncbi:hypothetical protein BH11PSE7_BH11PSE7_19220 [soil metagenome]